jgi:hypothetical protein
MADVKVVTLNNTNTFAAVLYVVPRLGEAMCSAKDKWIQSVQDMG